MYYFFVTLTFWKVKPSLGYPGGPHNVCKFQTLQNATRPAQAEAGGKETNPGASTQVGWRISRYRYVPGAGPSNQLRPKSPGSVTLVSRCERKFTEKVDGGAGEMVEYSHAHQTQMYIKLNLPEPVHIYRRTGVCFFGPTRSLDSGRAIFLVVYQAVTRHLNFFCEKHFNSSVSDLSKKKEGPGADLILLCFVLSIFEMTLWNYAYSAFLFSPLFGLNLNLNFSNLITSGVHFLDNLRKKTPSTPLSTRVSLSSHSSR